MQRAHACGTLTIIFQDGGAADMRLVHVCDGEVWRPFVRLGFICKGRPPERDRLGIKAQACKERMPAAPSRLFSRMGVPQICVLCMSATVRTGGPFVRLGFICKGRPPERDRLGIKAQAPSRLFSRMGVLQICVLCMSATVRTGGPSSASASSAKVDPQNVIGSGSRRRHARSTCLRHPDDPYLATSRGRPSSPKKEILRFTGSPLVFNKMISVWYPPPSAI